MREEEERLEPTPAEDLSLQDLLPSLATSGIADPGPDPTWDPDYFPPDKDDEGPAG